MLYFDHNASTPVAPEVAETMSAALREVSGNPSSTHAAGQLARARLEDSRREIATSLAADPAELIFTSGGTESNNLAILGLVRSVPGSRKHVITTTIEHPAVLETCRQLERENVEVTYVAPDAHGVVRVNDIHSRMRSDTLLVSVMHANNETGSLQPVEQIATLVHDRRSAGQSVFFHSDGVQAFGKIAVNVREIGFDLYSVSGHKIYGPKGTGALFISKGTPLQSILHGGRHEGARRPGTENVHGAIAFARAAELCSPADPAIQDLRNYFEAQICTKLEGAVNGPRDARLPNTSNLCFQGVSAEALMIALDMQGIAVSTGSACSSGSIEPSHVLIAMGLTQKDARSCVRFSFGRYNTPDDVEILIRSLVSTVTRLRRSRKQEVGVGV